jgi:hypothetical protein
VVEGRRQLDDPVAEADPLRALAGGREEDFRRARVRVLLEEVVLDLPDVVEAQLVGQLDLVERVLQQPLGRALLPWARLLMLVEEPEPHRSGTLPPGACVRDATVTHFDVEVT